MNQNNFLAVIAILFTCGQVQAATQVYFDQSDFLTETSATSTLLPNLGTTLADGRDSETVGDLTFTHAAGSGQLFHLFFSDFTPVVPGNEISLNREESLLVDISAPIYSFGFEFYEPTDADPIVADAFIDSTFEVTLKNGAIPVGSFTFNADNDVLSFVGVTSSLLFDQVEIIESVGGGENEVYGTFFTGSTQIIPEPSTLVLTVASLLGGLGLRRRR